MSDLCLELFVLWQAKAFALEYGLFDNVNLCSFVLTYHRSGASCLRKTEKHEIYRELTNCLDVLEPIDGKPVDEMVGLFNINVLMDLTTFLFLDFYNTSFSFSR